LHALGHGEWERAFALQPLLAVLLVTLIVYVPARKPISLWWSSRSLRSRRLIVWFSALLFLVWWAARIALYQRGLAGPV
jgi:hypothetical protein